jgi:hypothetical protein
MLMVPPTKSEGAFGPSAYLSLYAHMRAQVDAGEMAAHGEISEAISTRRNT